MPIALKARKRVADIDFEKVDYLKNELQCDRLLALILYNRGFETVEDCKNFLYPSEKDMLDPFSMMNMQTFVDRIMLAKEKGQHITVYGDYDVDGISATAILTSTFNLMGIKNSYYIPDRHTEGYGLNETAVNGIFEKGTDLIITVDCGIASCELIKEQIEKDREIIVTDHHTIGENIPECLVIKPGQPGDNYINTDLCGAGIAFKISQALLKEEAMQFIDFAAVATVADVVPLINENRFLVKKGLEKLNSSPHDCYSALLESADFKGEVTAQTIGFVISPRLNAAGRMESAETAYKFLMSSGDEAKNLAKTLSEFNLKRQETEKQILENIEIQIKEKALIRNGKALVLSGVGWDEGVVGICAARLTEKYKRPTIVFSVGENGIAKGSGRSIEGIDLYEMLKFASDILEHFGGHTMAAGMSVKADRIQELTDRFNEYLNYCDSVLFYPCETYDAYAKIEDVSVNLCKEFDLLEPYGCSNPEVKLRIDNCVRGGIKKVGALKNHLKLYLQDGTSKADAVAFYYEKHNCDYFSSLKGSAIVKLEINLWQNMENLSFKISEFKEVEILKPRQMAETLTSLFYSRLALPKTNKAQIEVISDVDDLNYMVSEWYDDDISGTLILCDHPEYSVSCIKLVEDEVPRFDISLNKPLNENCGYNTLVIGADIDKIDFTPFKRVVFYDMLNTGYADKIYEKAPWLQFYALKVNLELFDSLFEEYKQISRENMMLSYRAIVQSEGVYESFIDFLKNVAEKKQIPMPVLAVAVGVFCELQFINVICGNEFKITVNRDAQKRNLEESRYYMNLLKCVTNRN